VPKGIIFNRLQQKHEI